MTVGVRCTPRFAGAAGGTGRIARGVLVVLAACAWRMPVRAAGVDGYVEFAFTKGDTHTEDTATGLELDQSTQAFSQRYRLDFSHRFFPNLELRLGGSYEADKVTNELLGATFDSWRKRFTPYARLTLRTPTFGAELGYDRQQERFESGPSTAKLTQETWRANVTWSPVDLPLTRLEVARRNTYDLGRAGVDVVQDTLQLSSRYLAIDKVDLAYRGTLEEFRDRINDGELDTNFQSFRVGYSDSWKDRRLMFSTDYTASYRKTQTSRSGTGELIEFVVPAAGLSSLDDTPNRDPLAPNAAMIDGDKTTAAGVNLGLPGPGGDTRPRNFGVDLGFATEINTIVVWIDRDLTPQIASAFSWRVYTSDDNFDWTLRQTLSSVAFGPFENSFVVRFTATISRYVKLVVSPLNPGIPDATSWPDIQVTELESQKRQPSSDLSTASSRTSQLFNTDFRALLVPRANFYYEFSYFLSTQNNGPTLWTLSNGLSVSQAVSPIFTAAARLSREDRQERLGRQSAYLFSGSLSASPLPTFQASTVVSYTQEQGDFGRDSASVVLTGVAQLYRGISANLGLGKARIVPKAGGSTGSTDVNLGVSFAPHSKFTVNVLVQNRLTTSEYVEASRPDLREDLKTAEIGASYRPLRSLYLFASERWERSNVTGSRTLQNYSLSWTPFPDGAFHFNVFYDTTYRTELDEMQETLVPSIRWDITPRMYIDLTYQYLKSTSLLGLSRTEVASATFRAAF